MADPAFFVYAGPEGKVPLAQIRETPDGKFHLSGASNDASNPFGAFHSKDSVILDSRYQNESDFGGQLRDALRRENALDGVRKMNPAPEIRGADGRPDVVLNLTFHSALESVQKHFGYSGSRVLVSADGHPHKMLSFHHVRDDAPGR